MPVSRRRRPLHRGVVRTSRPTRRSVRRHPASAHRQPVREHPVAAVGEHRLGVELHQACSGRLAWRTAMMIPDSVLPLAISESERISGAMISEW